MADPLSVVAGVTGVLAFTSTLARNLTTLTTEIRDAPDDILDLRLELQNLSSLIRSAHDVATKYPLRPEDAPLAETVKECLERCQTTMEAIRTQLKPFLAKGTGRRSPVRIISWTIRKGEIRNSKDRLRDAKASLQLSVTVMSSHLMGKGQQEIKDEMAQGYEKLLNQFQNAEKAHKFRRRLEDDLDSVSATGGRRLSFTNATDIGLPMRKFFEEYHNATSLAPPTVYESQFQDNGDIPPPGPSDILQEASPLLQAAQAGNSQHVQRLLSLGASPSERARDGRTALHFCAIYDDTTTAAMLLDHGAEIDAQDDKARSPFRIAMRTESFGIAALLVQRGCALEKFIPTVFDSLQQEEDAVSFKEFLVALCKRLDSAGGPFLVHEALDRSDDAALERLLKAGANPNIRDDSGISPIHHAIILKRRNSVALLLQSGADINDYLPASTHDRLREDISWHKPLFPMLVSGITPIATAGRAMRDIEMLRFLLESGADPNWEYPDGVIVLTGVCASSYIESAKLLIDFGADCNHRDHGQHSPIYWAAICGNEELVRYMANHGANLNYICENHGNWTPLFAAIYHHREGVVRALIECGADLSLRDQYGRGPLELIEAYGDCNIKGLIESKGAASQS